LYAGNSSTKNKGLNALGNALIYKGNGRQLAVSDSTGHFKFNTSDTEITVGVSSVGYETMQTKLKSNTANYVLVNQLPDIDAKTEVIELENSRSKSKRTPADSLFPEGGWQSFREYVYKKLHKEKDMDTTGATIVITGGSSVVIEFMVDENGLARDLKITKSVNNDVDNKVLEVVRQWPKWIITRKNSKGKVEIQY
jgi:TonB family protein